MFKKFAIIGLVILFLTWCGYTQLTYFKRCDFEGALVDRKVIDEVHRALQDYEQQHGLTLEDWGFPMCATSGIEIFVKYETPKHLSKYHISYRMYFLAVYSTSSKTVNLQYRDSVTDESQNGLEFISSLENMLPEFESTAEVQQLIDQLNNRKLYGYISGDLIQVSTKPGIGLPTSTSGGYASISFSMTTRSIRDYNLPNYLDWPEFSELALAHQIVRENYLTGELEDCWIADDRHRYANTHVLYRTDSSIRIHVNVSCPNQANGTMRLNFLPDGTYEYVGFW